ncbi:RNA polymerase sigma factor [Paenibacillus sp. P46E]|uniref:RNA polymerase sigma factor n=1 Tax=Paenibacillus sp. P46E TaxID=1349436 RepID=UPI000A5F11D9|nr:sigma-70 family RNA polymerase sigma factor [Paenibacillus sp. P46E]
MELGWELEQQQLAHIAVMSEEQLRRIMGFYGDDIWNYIYYLTKSADMADDLAQEVFIKCYYRIGTYRGSSSLKAWLFTIARNTVFSHRKSRFFRSGLWGGVQTITRAEPAKNSFPDELLGTVRSAEMEYLGNRRMDEIWSVILQLPDKFREVLVLDLKAELSIQEIAGLTGLSTGTVKSRLHRARHKVQEKLRGMES